MRHTALAMGAALALRAERMHHPTRLAQALCTCAALVALAPRPAAAKVVCPGPNAVYGIDVSEWQGAIDWVKVKQSGKEFAIIRVSDGLGHVDPTFARNWADAKAAGMIRGVYQFFEPSQDAVQQANLLLQKMGPLGPGDLPPMIDVEADGGQSPAVINNKIHQWVDTVEKATGRRPLVYTGAWFWNPKVQSGDFVGYPLVDSYYCGNCCPDIAAPWPSWTMWQYSSTGQVPGIAGNVDLDRFDGTLADLRKLAGGVDWAAKYVAQSWPLAVSPLTLTVNQELSASITLKNVGGKGWDKGTRLGTTQPRDRQSAFAGPDWVGPSRAAACAAGAAPGQDCAFTFRWHAPPSPGEYHEFFSVVQEGVAWFSDPGQGGPADNVIEAWIKVVEADFHGEVVAQSPPAAPEAVTARLGEEVMGYVEVKNLGNQAWKVGVTKLAPTPRDQPCPQAAPDWLSPTRVSSVMADTAPGRVGRFPLTLRAAAQGDFTLSFGLVQEGVTWFADAPRGGGPLDGAIRVRLVVLPAQPPLDMAGSVADLGGSGADLRGVEGPPDLQPLVGVTLQSGCSVMAGAHGRARGGAPMALLFGLALLARRRRRAASGAA